MEPFVDTCLERTSFGPAQQHKAITCVPLLHADVAGSAYIALSEALQKHSNCPMQYKFSYVMRVPTATKTYFNLGLVVHEIIEHLTKLLLSLRSRALLIPEISDLRSSPALVRARR